MDIHILFLSIILTKKNFIIFIERESKRNGIILLTNQETQNFEGIIYLLRILNSLRSKLRTKNYNFFLLLVIFNKQKMQFSETPSHISYIVKVTEADINITIF